MWLLFRTYYTRIELYESTFGVNKLAICRSLCTYLSHHLSPPFSSFTCSLTRSAVRSGSPQPIFYEIDQKTKKCLKGKLTSDFVTYSVGKRVGPVRVLLLLQ